MSQKLFFFERVRDFFDEIFNQSVARVKNLIKKVENPREKEMFLAKILYEPPSTSRVLDNFMPWKILRNIKKYEFKC